MTKEKFDILKKTVKDISILFDKNREQKISFEKILN